MALVLRGGAVPGRGPADVRCDGGRIVAVGPDLATDPHDEVVDITGMLVVPAMVEPHAHLDKALSAELAPNETGDLIGAIRAWESIGPTHTVASIADRARSAALALVASGTTAIRTHVDVTEATGLLGIEALVQVRAELAELVDLQLVALPSWPLTGVAGASNRSRLRDAMAMGADVVGGCPHLDPDPAGTTDVCVALAAELGLPIDLHTDENLDPASLDVLQLARLVADGFAPGATASHCVSLGIQPDAERRAACESIAAAGVAVVTLPQTNLFLQGRSQRSATPRGLTAVRDLLAAGAVVAGGGDNIQDPFNLVGRADPLEAASLLVVAAHLLPDEAFHAVSAAGRRALGLEPVEVAVGAPAELVAIAARSVREAIGWAPAERVVVHRGQVVARTEVRRALGNTGFT